jgi:hypothetical protein
MNKRQFKRRDAEAQRKKQNMDKKNMDKRQFKRRDAEAQRKNSVSLRLCVKNN